MARRKKIDEQELMNVTEELLLTVGYDKLNFKLIANELDVGRSTIYEYYANKEELVAEHLSRSMTMISERIDQIEDEDQPFICLQKIIHLLITSTNVTDLLDVSASINKAISTAVNVKINIFNAQYEKLFLKITDCFKRAEQQGKLREDIPASMKTALLLKVVNIKKEIEVGHTEWTDMLLSILLNGLMKSNKK